MALWRAIDFRSTPGTVIERLLDGGIASLLGCVLCVALSQRQGESSRRDAGQMQLLAVLGAVGALLLLNSPLSSPEIRLWIALRSEERRVGQECAGTWTSRRFQSSEKTNRIHRDERL